MKKIIGFFIVIFIIITSFNSTILGKVDNPKNIMGINMGYIIITLPSLIESLKDFKTYKNSLGYNVRLIHTDWIDLVGSGNDIQEKIRNLLINQYTNWQMKYVLIVGSHYSIPMRECYPGTRDESDEEYIVPTDYYYADLTGDWDSDNDTCFGEPEDDEIDFKAEVYVGRIPFDDPEIVVKICNKIKNFELDNREWKKKVLLLGTIPGYENLFGLGFPRTDSAVIMEELWYNIFKNNGYSKTTMYEKDGIKPSIYPCDYPINHENVLNYWPDGFGVVILSSHGSPTGAWRMIWSEDINNDNIPQSDEISWLHFLKSSDNYLLNDEKSSIVVSDGCRNSYPFEENNLGASLLENGAVAFIGGTSYTYFFDGWKDRDDGGSGSHNYYFFHYLVNSRMSIGEALFSSKIYYFDNLMEKPPLEWRDWNYHNLYAFCLYGDPSIQFEERDTNPPHVEIIRPKNDCIYIMDKEINSHFFKRIIIFGDIQIWIEAFDNESGLNKIELYINDRLIDIFTSVPKNWIWDDIVFGKHVIRVIGYDFNDNIAEDEITVWKFF